MKIDTPRIYTSYYGLPTGNNPLYREPVKPEIINKERKVEKISKSGIDLRV
jgi:hypothetical protein